MELLEFVSYRTYENGQKDTVVNKPIELDVFKWNKNVAYQYSSESLDGDYGKITFSDVSGTTNFGVHSSSILTEATYNSVISGITSGDIASGTSGKHSNPNACNDVNGTVASFSSNCADLDISGNNADVTINSGVTISGEGDLDWVVNNSSGTLWDLVVTDELHQIQNTGYNNALTNLGIIAATENSSNAINNEESFATIINNGTISSNGSHAIHNNTSASITTLTNSGAIDIIAGIRRGNCT